MSKKPSNKVEQPKSRFTVIAPGDDSLIPILAAGGKPSITPPGRGGDKTERDRQRYKERQKGKVKGKIGDIIGDNPVITRPGKINVPVDPEAEPIWRPGRDGSGQGGPGKGKPGSDPGDYVEMDFEEFIEMFFESIGLPNMLKKMFAQTMVKTHKRRGLTNHGPRSRLNKRATAIARLRRAAAAKNVRPEEFVENFEEKCQSVFEAYVFWVPTCSRARVMASPFSPSLPTRSRAPTAPSTSSFPRSRTPSRLIRLRTRTLPPSVRECSRQSPTTSKTRCLVRKSPPSRWTRTSACASPPTCSARSATATASPASRKCRSTRTTCASTASKRRMTRTPRPGLLSCSTVRAP
ncbi:MAG: DUF444 family protein [Candidatus Obscuribacter sp.]|nr:DUF444 family protein [Candidatus Obscuribacter sp.]